MKVEERRSSFSTKRAFLFGKKCNLYNNKVDFIGLENYLE